MIKSHLKVRLEHENHLNTLKTKQKSNTLAISFSPALGTGCSQRLLLHNVQRATACPISLPLGSPSASSCRKAPVSIPASCQAHSIAQGTYTVSITPAPLPAARNNNQLKSSFPSFKYYKDYVRLCITEWSCLFSSAR